MNPGGREPRTHMPRSSLSLELASPTPSHRSLNHTQQARLIPLISLGICTLFALIALALLHQNSNTHTGIAKQRLLEVSLQDLVVQSAALRHIDHAHPYQTVINLEQQGYGSTVELLNQLAARLAVIEAVDAPEELAEHTGSMREMLLNLDVAINGKQGNSAVAVEQWFAGLALLNATVNRHNPASEHLAERLYRNTVLLSVMVLLICAGTAGKILWGNSSARQRLANRRQQLGGESMVDPLTGLLNAQAWLRMCELHLKNNALGNRVSSSLAIVNIDYFKQYCDTYGQAAGDSRLGRFAELLKANFRPSDLIARVGEHEFAVLMSDCSAHDAHRIIERMRKGQQHTIAFSAGVCDIDHTQSVSHIMAVADQALCEARKRQVAA